MALKYQNPCLKYILIWLTCGRKIPPDLMNARLEELNKIMENEYNIDKSFVERLIGDPWDVLKII